MPKPWRITLFGELRVEQGSQVITRFKYQKVGSLLAYLAYYPRQMHAREVLMDLFWRDSTPESARNNLSTALSSLRHQLEPPGTSPGTVIRADRYSAGLNPAMIRTDTDEFEQTIRDVGRVESVAERIQRMEQAVRLYKGSLLPGYYEDWVGPEQSRLEGLFFDTVRVLVQDLEQQGQIMDALRYARQAVSLDPLREEAREPLIRLLAYAGQPGAALRQYKEMERMLEKELQIEPSAPLRALARRIERDSGLAVPSLPVVAPQPPLTASKLLVFPPGQSVTVTLLLTDLEGNSDADEEAEAVVQAARTFCLSTLSKQIALYSGQMLKETDCRFVVAFQSAKKAVECAIACQQALAEQEYSDLARFLRVRMALHTGELEYMDGDYHGPALHRASWILTASHGGQILASNAIAELLRADFPESVRLLDLGVYRLREMPAPVRLHQLEYPGMESSAFPPLHAEAGYTPYLPVQVTRFFGREQEIATLVEKMQPHQRPVSEMETGEEVVTSSPHHLITPLRTPRLVTLTGPGGTGKTRLAIEAAERLVEAYQGAVWFAALADVSDPRLIAEVVLDVLQVPRVSEQEALEQIVTALSRQPSLLILDNLEHLVEEAARLVQTLLTRVSSLTILATSRQVLNCTGEQEYPVSALPMPNGGEGPEQLSLYDSVRLFVDRAQGVLPHFQVTNHNAPALAELCMRLEGIPLAIELAAARAQVLSPFQMLTQLSDRFALLTSRKRDVSERHRTLRATIEWSYRLLAPELQRFFNRLSVFRGGWTVEIAAVVCEEPLALDYLAQLRECSQVNSEENGQGMRFRMLETIREYAAERLTEASEEEALKKRHADCFLALFRDREFRISGLERVAAEHENINSALAWCFGAGGVHDASRPLQGLKLAAVLWDYWFGRGHLREGRAWMELALEQTRGLDAIPERLDAFHGAGNLAAALGDYAAAGKWYEEGLAEGRESGDLKRTARLLNSLANMEADRGDFEQARIHYEESLVIRRKIGDPKSIALGLSNLGQLLGELGDDVGAIACLEESLELKRDLAVPMDLSATLNNLGTIAFRRKDYTKARKYAEEAVAIAREQGHLQGISITAHNLGNVLRDQKDWAGASALYVECLEIDRESGNLLGLAQDLAGFAYLAAYQEHLERAAILFGSENALRESLGVLQRPPVEQKDYEEDLNELRSHLGEEAFLAAWETGARMTLEEAIAYALEVAKDTDN